MLLGKMMRSLSVGLLVGIFAIGLLPFLVIYNWAEMYGMIDLDTAPLFLLVRKFIIGSSKAKPSNHAADNTPESEK